MSLKFEDAPFSVVTQEITRQTGKRIYFVDPSFMDERITVHLNNLRWDDAVQILGGPLPKTVYTYPDGAFIDWACTDGPPDWSGVQRIGHLPSSGPGR